MKTIRTGLCLAALAVGAGAQAESKVTTTIAGETIPKEAVKMTFDNDLVTITFSDNSTRTEEMNLVNIALDHNQGSSGLTNITADPKAKKGVYNLKGQYLGEKPEGLPAGIYIVNGQKVSVR